MRKIDKNNKNCSLKRIFILVLKEQLTNKTLQYISFHKPHKHFAFSDYYIKNSIAFFILALIVSQLSVSRS